MSNKGIDLEKLALDELGRVVLSDEQLAQIEGCESTVSAGANLSCGGSTNGSCTNGSCGSTTNGSCTNQVSCSGATNNRFCPRLIGDPPA